MNVFQLFSGIKEKRLDKMMQSNYLCVVLLVKRKNYQLSLFLRDRDVRGLSRRITANGEKFGMGLLIT